MALRFKRSDDTPPEIVLVPFIDILLVVLIFMATSATFSRYAELQVQLPQAQGQASDESVKTLWVQINAQGQVVLNRESLGRLSAADLSKHLKSTAGRTEPPPMVVIGADARTPHQAVISVMEAARMAGLTKITFMSNNPGRKP
ncbi:MAG: biopolymer transporter ExbD [Alphaproteobacteria bacterium]|nr:biopolymer transporter ExbD [Alphaproteobacteria bacterium]